MKLILLDSIDSRALPQHRAKIGGMLEEQAIYLPATDVLSSHTYLLLYHKIYPSHLSWHT